MPTIDINLNGVQPRVDVGLWDWWSEIVVLTTVSSYSPFVGAAVSSGTNSTAIPVGSLLGYNPHGVFLRSNTTANGGYRYQTSSISADYFGVISHKYRCQFMWLTSFTGRTIRFGYHDTLTVTDAVDGAYFEALDGTLSCKTASNSTRTTSGTTLALSLNVAYTLDIEVNAAGTLVTYNVYAGTSTTPVLTTTIATNIPNTTARTFGCGIVATEVSTTASDIGILYRMGMGTVNGFNRVIG